MRRRWRLLHHQRQRDGHAVRLLRPGLAIQPVHRHQLRRQDKSARALRQLRAWPAQRLLRRQPGVLLPEIGDAWCACMAGQNCANGGRCHQAWAADRRAQAAIAAPAALAASSPAVVRRSCTQGLLQALPCHLRLSAQMAGTPACGTRCVLINFLSDINHWLVKGTAVYTVYTKGTY